MHNKTIRRRSLLRHWTFLYVSTLFIGLLLIGALSIFWIRTYTIQHRLQVMQLLAQELAHHVINESSRTI